MLVRLIGKGIWEFLGHHYDINSGYKLTRGQSVYKRDKEKLFPLF